MIVKRPGGERGRTQAGWLDSRHTFSFGGYHDPGHMGYRVLRVINEDRVEPGMGFAPHGHADMEILSYVLEGALEHKDSLGNGSIIRPGDVQRMSAGTGVRHSEFNPSRSEKVHFLQIWITPEKVNQPPGYEQKAFDRESMRGRWRLLASRDGRDGSVTIHQDAAMLGAFLEPGEEAEYTLGEDRHAWIQVARGRARVNGETLGEGDGAAVSGERTVHARAEEPSDLLLFDLP
jgi:redox-sensitive bicupin YhaK (pirin superfamily)